VVEAYPDRMRPTRIGPAVVLCGLLLLAGGCDDDKDSSSSGATSSSTAPSELTTTSAAPAGARLTPEGYGRLTLGMTLDSAKSDGLVTNERPGCELAGPGQVTAEVAGLPDGYGTFDDGKLTNISALQGETAEGLRIGATIDEAKQIYSGSGFTVTVDETPVEVFEFISVTVKRNGAEAYEFAAEPKSKKIEQLATPHLLICD